MLTSLSDIFKRSVHTNSKTIYFPTTAISACSFFFFLLFYLSSFWDINLRNLTSHLTRMELNWILFVLLKTMKTWKKKTKQCPSLHQKIFVWFGKTKSLILFCMPKVTRHINVYLRYGGKMKWGNINLSRPWGKNCAMGHNSILGTISINQINKSHFQNLSL